MIFINHEHKEKKNQQNTEILNGNEFIDQIVGSVCLSIFQQTRKQIRYMYNQQVYLYTLNEAHLSALTMH